jgi:hypothetical protein
MRFSLWVGTLAALMALPAMAADKTPTRDALTADAPPPPPPPAEATGEVPASSAEPEAEVTITTKGTEIHEEHRVNGKLYMVKVTPKIGKPYYLIDREGSGEFRRSDFEPNIAVPMWVIKRF